MLMTIDIGNTNIVIGSYDKNKLINIDRIKTNPSDIAGDLELNDSDFIAISSVVPSVEKALVNKLNSNNLFLISHLNSGICLDVDSPEDVGNDSFCFSNRFCCFLMLSVVSCCFSAKNGCTMIVPFNSGTLKIRCE